MRVAATPLAMHWRDALERTRYATSTEYCRRCGLVCVVVHLLWLDCFDICSAVYRDTVIEGWAVHVNQRLLGTPTGQEALKLLAAQLYNVTRVRSLTILFVQSLT